MTETSHIDSYGVRKTLETELGTVRYFSLPEFAERGFPRVNRLPFSIRVVLESILRNEDGFEVTKEHVEAIGRYNPADPDKVELPFKPARVLLQDFTGVPSVVDLAAMRSAMARLGGDPGKINPILPVDLVIDHSVQVDYFNSSDALRRNAELEFQRNRERYEFLRWGQAAFKNFAVVPPASGICHQVNLEYLGKVVQLRPAGSGDTVAYFDSLVGTDSHTPMINGLGVLGWGVGGIEAEAAMLGQPLYILAPPVVGFKLTGKLRSGITATDLVLTITQLLRKHGVVGKFVEFFGPGLSAMSVPDRATISNMAPEYGATVGYFPIDQQTLDYMHATGRPEALIRTVEQYAKAQDMFRTDATADPEFEAVLELDLADVQAGIAGPKRPQDRINLSDVKQAWRKTARAPVEERGYALDDVKLARSVPVEYGGGKHNLKHGDVVIAAITSCTNTSNPSVLLAAGLVAKKAAERGLTFKPWVKTSFAPGSVVVTEYLQRTGLMSYLEKMGFYLVGYGCTTCIGNSGPVPEPIARAIEAGDLVVAGVLSGNRNFEGRINPHVKANFLMSPPLVVVYAIAGTVDIDLVHEPIGHDAAGNPVYLRDVWPDDEELNAYLQKALDRDAFIAGYSGIENSNADWNAIATTHDAIYNWREDSTYIQEPPFFQNMRLEVSPIQPIRGAHVLVVAGDSITTDHISPAGSIASDSPAGHYLKSVGVERAEFNSYGSRRGNDRVMTRGTFANIRFRNKLAPGTEGSKTTHVPSGEVVSIFEAAQRYQAAETPTVVLAGKDYGMGSSRDWAAKGVQLLGVRAVIAESFERIHRSNLVGMGVLPLQFVKGQTADSIGLTGFERFSIEIDDTLRAGQIVPVTAYGQNGTAVTFETLCRIDTPVEVEYFRNGGILHTVLRKFVA